MGHVPLLILPIIPLALIGNHPAPLRARLLWSVGLVIWLVAGALVARHIADFLTPAEAGRWLVTATVSMYLLICSGAWLSYFLFRKRHPAAWPS